MNGVTVKLREAYELPSADQLDETKGILLGVKVLGLKSKNGRQYTPASIKAAMPLIEGAKVFFDHPDEEDDGADKPRKFGERFARLRGARVDAKGEAYADLHFNPHHPQAKSFLWYVKNDPKGLGLSLNGDGTTIRRDGVKLVDCIQAIRSFDIVDSPATVEGLFEQHSAKAIPDVKALAAELFADVEE